MKTTILLALLASQAWATDATPTGAQLASALANAKAVWGVIVGPVEVRLDPINPCDMFATPRVAVVEVHDFHTIITYDDGTKADGGTTYQYVIRINSNCNWDGIGLDLETTMIHEYGHILMRDASWHSKDPRSVMYPIVNARQTIRPEDWYRLSQVLASTR